MELKFFLTTYECTTRTTKILKSFNAILFPQTNKLLSINHHLILLNTVNLLIRHTICLLSNKRELGREGKTEGKIKIFGMRLFP